MVLTEDKNSKKSVINKSESESENTPVEIITYSLKQCPACEKIMPELKKLEQVGFKIKVIDCEKESLKCKDIEYTPTVIIKRGNKSRKIEEFATAEEIKSEFGLL